MHGLSADNNEKNIIYELLKKDDTNVALKAMLWTTLTLHFKKVDNLADNFKRSLSNSKSVLDYMIQQLKIQERAVTTTALSC